MITTTIKAKIVRKGRGFVTQGIYDYPKISPRLGALSPKPDDVAKAVARKDGQVLSVSASSSRAARLCPRLTV